MFFLPSTRRAALATFSSLLLFLTHAAYSQTVVRDFTTQKFDYGYEEWQDLASVLNKTPEGIQIQGNAKGGLGVYFPQILDLSEATHLEVKVRRGPNNTETKLLLKLIAADGKSVTWDVPINDAADTEFTALKLDLSTAAGKIELEEIKQLQIQGTFNPANKVDCEIQSITATK